MDDPFYPRDLLRYIQRAANDLHPVPLLTLVSVFVIIGRLDMPVRIIWRGCDHGNLVTGLIEIFDHLTAVFANAGRFRPKIEAKKEDAHG